MERKRPRLTTFDYLGLYRYFLTLCTHLRHPTFRDAKQKSGYGYSQSGRGRLWQPSYFDRVLRDDERTTEVIAYIVENPIRAGLASTAGEYEFAGSATMSMSSIGEILSAREGVRQA